MTAASVCAIVLTFLNVVPGETTGWGTGEVEFVARVSSDEHQEIYPIGAGRYTVELIIMEVLSDPQGVLAYKTRVDGCYENPRSLVSGDTVEVLGTYHDGAAPLPYYGRVEARYVYKLDDWQEPDDDDDDDDDDDEEPEILSPSILTGAVEATETSATMQGILLNDGGEACRARFVYKTEDGRSWSTEWQTGLNTGQSFSQKVEGMVPGTYYICWIEAENSAGWSIGRQAGFRTLEENVPPIPYPAVWATAPDQIDTAAVTMMADVERDLTGPQEYAFDFVESPTGGSGGTDSVWQFSPVYVDVGLNPNHQYGYRIHARDGNGNETAFSPVAYAYTDIETPTGVAFGQITTGSIQAKAAGALSNLASGQSGLKLENVTAGHISEWQHENTFWTSEGLLPNTRYGFRAQARNGDGDPTPFSPETRVHTLAMVPGAVTFSNVTTSQILIYWSSNGNPSGTQYWCQNTVSNANSGWAASTRWPDAGLSPNVKYTYRVKARNGDGVETAFSASASSYSAVETPTGIVFGTITATSIQVKSQNTPSNLNQGESGLWFENVTLAQTSSWRRDNNPWTSDSLLPNRSYSFRARARNGDTVQTPYCEAAAIHTHANPPTAAGFTGITPTSIQVQWGANGNPAGTLYLCENTTAGVNSGWTTDTTWDSTGLTPSTSYSYRVKARNADGVETAWTSLGTQSTEYRSLTISSTAGGKVSSPAQSVTRYAPGAVVNLMATPIAGYHFLEWSGTAVDAGRVAEPTAAQTTVVVDAHYTLVANFLRTRIYVDKRATGAGNGSNWQNAFTSLQDALAVAQRGNEICVAQGVYKPDAGKNVTLGDRLAAFEIPSGVKVKGGYAGAAHADPNTRSIILRETTLSGDLTGDDKAVAASHDLYSDARRTDNSIHVVVAYDAAGTTLLEGFTITGGNGLDGAGICMIRSDLVVSQCTISVNRVGELSGDGSEGWGVGAGVSCYLCQPTFSECVFYANWAGGQGGALYSVESSPTLTGCFFRGNEAGMEGGALYGQDSNSVAVGCTFHANWSWDGGALFNDDGSTTRLTNCRFMGNAGFGSGGAVFDAGEALEIINSVFSGNLAYGDGGALAVTQGPALVTNCTFNRNAAQAKQTGQTLAVYGTTLALANCIVWNSYLDTTREQIALSGTTDKPAELIVSYCDVYGGFEGIIQKLAPTVTWGGTNLAADPKFQSPAGPDGIVGTEDDDLRLKAGSPCLDAGNNCVVPPDADDLDADGNRLERLPLDLGAKPRFADDPATPDTGNPDAPAYPWIVDLGAYEL